MALEPRPVLAHLGGERGANGDPLAVLDRLVRERRSAGGSAASGLAVLAAYELLDRIPSRSGEDDRLPAMVVLAVEASLSFPGGGRPVLTLRDGRQGQSLEARLGWAIERLDRLRARALAPPAPARPVGALRTSLPRADYHEAVVAVKRHIRRGDIYQANLTQRFRVSHDGDAFESYRRLIEATPAPRSAFVEMGSLALASASPESFLRVDPDGFVETRPIKGTRRRGTSPEEDLARARSLLGSEKDRAELLMIVDLERNDLGRVCRTGSVRVPELAALRSYAAVHHLVARVEGELRPGMRPSDLIRATFPGGSVTGAPKIRAIEILRELEPVRRSYYTGSLFWLGDDGAMESSILIRSIIMSGGQAYVGAGGGIVADSEPEAEWQEANDKARAVLGALGYAPEEAA